VNQFESAEHFKKNFPAKTNEEDPTLFISVEWMLEYQQGWKMPAPQHFNCQP
jgi:hypothetical protein